MKHFALPILTLLFVACSEEPKPAEGLTIVMSNETGGHMKDFELNAGGGIISYSIFSKDYTFREVVQVQEEAPVRVTYTLDDGTIIDEELEVTVKPAFNQGLLRITFGEEETEFKMRVLKKPQPAGSLAGNLKSAKKFFDAIEIGMPADEAGMYVGMSPKDRETYSWGIDYGKYDKDETVMLIIFLVADEVVRVEIKKPYKSRKGEILEEKGVSEKEFNDS